MVFYFIVMHVVSHSVIAQFCFRGAKPLKGKEDALLTYSSLCPNNRLDRHVYLFRHCIAGSSSQPRAVPVQKWTDDLEVGHVAELEGRESRFWEELIDKYLLPLEKDPEKEKKIQRGANRAAQHYLPLLLPHQQPVRRPRLNPAVCGTGLLQPEHQGDAAATGLFSTGTDTTVL